MTSIVLTVKTTTVALMIMMRIAPLEEDKYVPSMFIAYIQLILQVYLHTEVKAQDCRKFAYSS